MSQPDPFDAVVASVLDHADGRRHLKVLPASDAETLARGLHARADELGAERQVVADEEGLTVACSKGCSACCRVPVVVYQPEAIAVARWLRQPHNAGARRGFEERYASWRAAVGDRVDALIALQDAGDIDAAESAYAEISDLDVKCAFLRDGACSIYPVRPNACRYFIALETAEHCQVGSATGPAILDHPPYDELMKKGRYLLRAAASIGIGGPGGGPGALCDRVSALLSEKAEVGRNDPCPCGSGKKHKRCCGR